MCGICGRLSHDRERAPDAAGVERMSAALAHRGPDGGGIVARDGIALGARRLAIVARGPAAAQPMRAPDAAVWIVHNGEIFEHQARRSELEQRGHRFRSRCDTEVVLRLYLEHGADCVARLDGMFAFAIWDERRRELLLARDRYGEKPLYYREDASGLAFASEIKALLTLDDERREVDPEALHHFLSFDAVPEPRTVFRGIRALPPGHRLRCRDGRIEVDAWFRPSLATRRPAPSPEEAERELRDRLRRAVARRRATEVPFGVFLSGGIDSAAIVALLAECGVAPLRTFSIGFRETSHDESRWARQLAQRFGAEHHEWIATPDLAAELPAIVRHFDQPFGDPSMLPTWWLAQQARPTITVALTGEGGDEALAGYDRYRKDALAAAFLRQPVALRRAAGLLRPLGRLPLRFHHPLRQLARLAALTPAPEAALYARWLLHADESDKRQLYSEELSRSVGEDSTALLAQRLGATGGADRLARALGADTVGYLPEDLLVKTDRATMAHGLEARCPFLDDEVMTYAAALPSELKLRGTTTKWILRRALRDLLPAPLLRRRKRGFGLPLEHWLRGTLRPLVHELLLGRRASERGLFRAAELRRRVGRFERGDGAGAFLIWNLLVLELWHRERVDVAG